MKKHTFINTSYLLIAIILIGCNDNEDDIQLKNRITLEHVDILYNVLPPGYYNEIKFTSENIAYTITNDGKIFKTEDGGNTWTQQDSGTELILHSMYFLNDLHGYIVGGYDDAIILKTTDGGVTWSSVDLQEQISAIHFINETTGFASGHKLFVTKDGGDSWDEMNLGYNFYGSLNFFDEKSGLLIADKTLLSTSDGGMNWKAINNYMLDDYFHKKILIFDSIACLFSGSAKTFITLDKGASWHNFDPNYLNSIYYFNDQQAIGVGQNWVSPSYINSSSYSTAPVIGSSYGKLSITNDGGSKWMEDMYFSSEEFSSINSIDLSNDSTALAIGDSQKGCVIKLIIKSK